MAASDEEATPTAAAVDAVTMVEVDREAPVDAAAAAALVGAPDAAATALATIRWTLAIFELSILGWNAGVLQSMDLLITFLYL